MRARLWGDEAAAGAFWGLGWELCGGRSASLSPKPRTPSPTSSSRTGGRSAGAAGVSVSPLQLSSFPGRSGAAPVLEMPPAPGSGFPALPPRPPGLLLARSRALRRLLPGPTNAPPARARSPLRGLHNQAPDRVGKTQHLSAVGEKGEPPRCPCHGLQRCRRGVPCIRRSQTLGVRAPLVNRIFSIFGICAKLLRSQWWGAGGARLLHLFELGPG